MDSRDKLIEKLRALVAKQAFQLEQQALRNSPHHHQAFSRTRSDRYLTIRFFTQSHFSNDETVKISIAFHNVEDSLKNDQLTSPDFRQKKPYTQCSNSPCCSRIFGQRPYLKKRQLQNLRFAFVRKLLSRHFLSYFQISRSSIR